MTSSASEAAEAPRMSRRHAAGAGSARGLLFTVLGEFVLPTGGAVWTSSLIDVFGRLGVEEKATRQALMRTAGDGWLAAERHGRRARWHLTSSAEQLLTDGTQRIYGFRAVAAEWDGHMLLALARVPETDRVTRHLLRSRLSWAGFGTPSPGVWISTHTERVEEVERLLSAAGVDDARIFRAEHVGGAELVSMVRQAWDLDSVEARYRGFPRGIRQCARRGSAPAARRTGARVAALPAARPRIAAPTPAAAVERGASRRAVQQATCHVVRGRDFGLGGTRAQRDLTARLHAASLSRWPSRVQA